MQDRPTYDELLAAIEAFLDEEIVPNAEGSRGFHARVAANAIRAVRRELAAEEEQLAAEGEGLEALLGQAEEPRDRAGLRRAVLERNEELCELIRLGEADDGPRRTEVVEHVWRTVRDKVEVSNPALLERSGRAAAV